MKTLKNYLIIALCAIVLTCNCWFSALEPVNNRSAKIENRLATASTDVTPVVEIDVDTELDVAEELEPNAPSLTAKSNKSTINNDSIIDSGLKTRITAYDFRKEMKVGIAFSDDWKSWAEIPQEGQFGVTAKVDGQKVKFQLYSNISTKPSLTYASSTKNGITYTGVTTTKKGNIDINKWITYNDDNALAFGTADNNTTSTVVLKFKVDGHESTLHVYIYKDENGDLWLCRCTTSPKKTLQARIDKINKYLKACGITPENSLSVDEILYPINDNEKQNWKCHTQKWADLSDSLVKSSWSDERKVLAIHDWISKNIAYDYWQYRNLSCPRDWYYKDFSGKYSVWKSHTGTCYDMTQIFIIMCRAQGIPAITCESSSHEWVIYYVNDRWYECNITWDCNSKVNGKDVTNVVKGNVEWTSLSAEGWTGKAMDILTVNNELWTWNKMYYRYSYPEYKKVYEPIVGK